ncbi:MAG TPA: hypothetical protein PL041_07180 [Melioribacteraceae bacterium]|nr:hypothetical protein [Melioribacteraceae bacterium]
MSLVNLVNTASNKEKFLDIQSFIDFTSCYLEFISNARNIQATIISRNENHYQFIQYKSDGTFNVTRPLNSNLMMSLETFENSKDKFLTLISNIRDEKNNLPQFRELLNNFIYTLQQSIGSALDALPASRSNTARKLNGDLFERLIRLLLSEIGLECSSGVIYIPVKIGTEEAFKMSYQHDLIIKSNGELKAFGSVKTSSKDRLDKIFIDKFLYSKLTDSNIPHFSVFLNDVQRKKTSIEGQYGINPTFLSGHFKGYTIKLNPLDGVYYCDIRPNMISEPILKDHIKTLDCLLFDDIWSFI